MLSLILTDVHNQDYTDAPTARISSPKEKQSVVLFKGCISCSITFFLIISVSWIISTVLFVKFIPLDLHEKTTKVYGEGTLLLDSNMEWLESATIKLNHNSCPVRTITVVETSSCSIATLTHNTTIVPKTHFGTLLYGLEGSTINATIPRGEITPIDKPPPHIWITKSIEAFHVLRRQLDMNKDIGACDTYTTDDLPERCHPVGKSDRGQTLVFKFKEAGYYTLTLTYPNDTMDIANWNTNIDWSYILRTYDIDTIKRKFKDRFTEYDYSVIDQDSFTIQTSRSFHFNHLCIFLSFKCVDTDYYPLQITHLKRRSDTIELILILYLTCAVVSIFVLLLSITVYLKCKRSKLSSKRFAKFL